MNHLSRVFAVIMLWACQGMEVEVFADEPVSVRFTMHSPDLSPSTRVYLTGGAPPLGDWGPEAVQMTYAGAQTWTALVVFNRPMWVEYKYNLGSFEREGADRSGQPLSNFSVFTKRNLEVTDLVPAWTTAKTVRRERGQLSGNVKFHRFVQGREVPPRDLVVWLPRYYEQQVKRRYPVLYMHDGQNVFDPSTSSGGSDWEIDETVGRLIADGAIEPMIVVGIYSGEDRLKEYSPQDGGEAYMRYVINRVKPLIDERYRTAEGPESALTGGSAMGGLIAFALAWEYPETFGAAISMSPTFKVEGRMDSTPWFMDRAGDEIRRSFFYLDNGGIGVDEVLQPGIDEMIGHLQQWGYRWERDFVFVKDWEAGHDTNAWSRRFPRALQRAIRGAKRFQRQGETEESP